MLGMKVERNLYKTRWAELGWNGLGDCPYDHDDDDTARSSLWRPVQNGIPASLFFMGKQRKASLKIWQNARIH